MKKVVLTTSVLLLFLILALSNIGGCGDDPCNFDFNLFLNGSSIDNQTSEWDCKNAGQTVFILAFFGDMTGTRSDIGDFVYDQTQCRRVEFENLAGSGRFVNIEGTAAIGILSLRQQSDDFGDIDVACELIEFE